MELPAAGLLGVIHLIQVPWCLPQRSADLCPWSLAPIRSTAMRTTCRSWEWCRQWSEASWPFLSIRRHPLAKEAGQPSRSCPAWWSLL